MADFTNREKADAADREVRQRRRVYPRWIDENRMTQQFADRQIAIMDEIAREYRAVADREDAAGRLL